MNKKDKAFEKKKAEKLAELEKQSQQEKEKAGVPLRPEMQETINVDLKKLRDNHVFIATPCYGGMVGEPYLKALSSKNKQKTGLGLGIFIGKTLLEKNFASILCRNSKTRNGAEVIIRWENKDLLKI